ncbi:MAG: hypothetical protein MUO89_01835 [Dehalococcoidia bacterium]|nr:hypothetical protein [Dehalococcoidia bacterium]
MACQAAPSYGEADVFQEETGNCTGETPRDMGLGNHARIVEIMSGRANFQQGLTANCEDCSE